MRRRLLNAVTVLSLLMCVTVAAKWVRSHWTADEFGLRKTSGPFENPERRFVNLKSAGGGLYLYWGRRADPNQSMNWARLARLGEGWHLRWDSSSDPSAVAYPYYGGGGRYGLGVQANSFRHEQPWSYEYPRSFWVMRWLVFPHALLAGAAAILPVVRLRQMHRDRRQRNQGRCVRCGYDLTANVSGTCPECGTAKRLFQNRSSLARGLLA